VKKNFPLSLRLRNADRLFAVIVVANIAVGLLACDSSNSSKQNNVEDAAADHDVSTGPDGARPGIDAAQADTSRQIGEAGADVGARIDAEDDGSDEYEDGGSDADFENDAGDDASKDSGTDPDDPSSRGDFYPLVDGARWVYRHLGGNEWDEEVELNKTTYEGETAFALSDNPGPDGTREVSILVRDGERVLRIARDEFSDDTLDSRTTYDPGFLRFDAGWLEKSAGFSETLSYRRIKYDEDGSVKSDNSHSHEYTVRALSVSVEVVAGRFDDCIQIERDRVLSPGVEAEEGDLNMFWFCPDVGKVLEEDQVTGEREELVSCEIRGGACP
jgi:hypothetical protein